MLTAVRRFSSVSQRSTLNCYTNAQKLFPGGSNGEFRFKNPIILREGKGARVTDITGKRYVDFTMGWGSVLAGHSHPEIVGPVGKELASGTNFAGLNVYGVELAAKLNQIHPESCQQVRLVGSGTEATEYICRLMRAYTDKQYILKFEGAYHGSNTIGITSLFPIKKMDYPFPEPTSGGIDNEPKILVAPFNDYKTTEKIINEYSGLLAGVLVEPIHRCTPPKGNFLGQLREICDQKKILLGFDEVVTGFRLHLGGAETYYRVKPDLVAYGKALGGGFPIGVVAGRSDIMELFNENRMNKEPYVWGASTYGGNPVSSLAALKMIEMLEDNSCYEFLHHQGRFLRDELTKLLKEFGIEAQVIGNGPMCQIIFSPNPVQNYREQFDSEDREFRQAFMNKMVDNGVYLNPMSTKLYLSLAHKSDVIDEFLNKTRKTLNDLRNFRDFKKLS